MAHQKKIALARQRLRLAISTSIITLAGLSTAARSQGTPATPAVPEVRQSGAAIQEIVVTAQRRGEDLQKVPIAISALSAAQLQVKGITSIADIVQATPTIYNAYYPTTNTTLFLFMRGMGLGDPIQITKDGAIGIYENGVYNPRPQTIIFDLNDVERVEVLRGPQGTLYGRNTTGGAVNVISRAPKGEFDLRVLGSYASRNQYRSVTNLDLPEFANISIKGTLALGGDDGFGKNRHAPGVPATNNFNSESHIGGKIAARWKPSDNFTADYTFEVARIRSTPMLLQAPSLNGRTLYPGLIYQAGFDRAYRPASLFPSHVHLNQHALTLNWQLSSDLTLRSITGLNHFQTDTYQDSLEVYQAPIFSLNNIHSNQFTQELQAIGSAWDDRIKYTVGAYYYRERASHNEEYNIFLGGLDEVYLIHALSKSVAGYAQLTFTPPILGDRMDLTAGARVTHDNRSANRIFYINGALADPLTRNSLKFTRFNPSFTATYRWTPRISTYAKVSTGYRAGGSSETTPDFTETYGPESLTSYEVGLKSEFFQRHVRANIAAYYNQYKDIQLDLSLDPNNPTITATRNAGRAHLEGIEADVSAVITRDLRVDVSYAYLHTKITRVESASGANIADMFRIPYAPKHALNVSADYTVIRSEQGDLTIHGDYSYKSSVSGTAGAGPAVPGNEFYTTKAYTDVNGRITLGRTLFGNPAQISIFSKNLLNSRHIVYSTASGSQIGGFNGPAYSYAAPRTVGVELSFELGGSR